MASPVQSVEYTPSPRIHLEVSSLLSADAVTSTLGRVILKLVAAARKSSREASGLLPEGAVDARFNPDDISAISGRVKKMKELLDRGGQYWLAGFSPGDYHFDPALDGIVGVAGLVGVSEPRPSLLQKLFLFQKLLPDAPDINVNEMLVAPSLQERIVGPALLHAVTKHAGFDPKKSVALDKLSPELGGHEIELIRMTTEGRTSVGGVSEALEEHYPWLRDAKVTP